MFSENRAWSSSFWLCSDICFDKHIHKGIYLYYSALIVLLMSIYFSDTDACQSVILGVCIITFLPPNKSREQYIATFVYLHINSLKYHKNRSIPRIVNISFQGMTLSLRGDMKRHHKLLLIASYFTHSIPSRRNECECIRCLSFVNWKCRNAIQMKFFVKFSSCKKIVKYSKLKSL